MRLDEARRQHQVPEKRQMELTRTIATVEGQIELNINQLKNEFGNRIPEDPTEIPFAEFENEVNAEIEELKSEIDVLLGHASSQLDAAEGELDAIVGSK